MEWLGTYDEAGRRCRRHLHRSAAARRSAPGGPTRRRRRRRPQDQSIGVAAGVRLICEKADISPSDIELILHGTTVATNAVLEGKGARVGLLVTEGFEYTLHLAKAWTPGPLFGWINMDKPDPLASLADTRGIPERMNARGEIVRPLDLAAATRADRRPLLVGHRGADHLADAFLCQPRPRAAAARHRRQRASRRFRFRCHPTSCRSSANTTAPSPR